MMRGPELCSMDAIMFRTFHNVYFPKTIGMKIAKCCLQLKHLKAAYDSGSLKAILIEKVNGKSRVTSATRIITALALYLGTM